MAPVADRVKETSTTTGTGSLALLGAVTQFRTFTSQFGLNVRFWYAIQGQTGSEWEVGIGYLSGTTTLVRERIYASSNANAVVTLSAGTKDVFVTLPTRQIQGKGRIAATSMRLAGGS